MYDLCATKIVMQPCLYGCSMLSRWPANTEIPVLRVAWHSITKSKFPYRLNLWHDPQRTCYFPWYPQGESDEFERSWTLAISEKRCCAGRIGVRRNSPCGRYATGVRISWAVAC